MTKEFSELQATMTPTARLESAAVAAALPTQLPLHERPNTCAVVENVATYLQLDMDATSMPITTISSREFNQDTSRAKKAAQEGPVFITDRGRPAHVLITIEEYQRLTGRPMTLVEALAQPDVPDFEFDPPKIKGPLTKPVDFT